MPSPKHIAFALTALACAAGCGEPPPRPPIETVDIEPALEIDTAEDPQALERQSAIAGILPDDFPADLPLYSPASLIDFGETEDGRLTVTLLTPHGISKVRRALYAQLGESGWTKADGSGATALLRKGGRRAWLHLEDGGPGTVYRYEYLR